MTDKALNKTKYETTVIVKDLQAPIISGFSDLTMIKDSSKTPDYLSQLMVEDDYDGNLTSQITVDDSLVDYDNAGSYPVYYQVEDTSGNKTTVEITLTIFDNSPEELNDVLGLPIDIVKSTNQAIDFGKPIFSEDWLSTITVIKSDILESEFNANASFNYATFNDSIYHIDKIIEEKTNLSHTFLNDAIIQFENTIKNRETYDTQYYFVSSHIMRKYELSLYGYRSNKEEFIDNLNIEYLSDLDKLDTNQLFYEDFFKKYGTHYVVRSVYGAESIIFYSVLSHEEKTVEEIENSKFSEISVGVPEDGGTSTSITESNEITYFAIYLNGGTGLSLKDNEDFNEQYNIWIKTMNDEHYINLISFRDDSIIPLWEILPIQYAHLKDEMEIKYYEYKDNNPS